MKLILKDISAGTEANLVTLSEIDEAVFPFATFLRLN
jgi:hypothetical protein